MELNVELFAETLPIMGVGMLCIFIVTVVLIGGTALMNRIFSGRGGDDGES